MNPEQIRLSCRTNSIVANQWLAVLEATCHQFGINTPLQKAAFLSQAGYESIGLTAIEENLNYSAPRLLAVFPGKFDQSSSLKYEHDPAGIANRVYANRFGNGDEVSGDGWKYRGRGIFQITFHDNYSDTAKRLNIDCLNDPDLLLLKKNAADSAAAYFVDRGLLDIADLRDINQITYRISGSMRTAPDRKLRFDIACKTFGI